MLDDVVVEPAFAGEPKNAVIILHGLGDCASGIIGLGEAFRPALPNTVFHAPNAPFPCDFSPFGFQWFGGQDWSPAVVLAGIQKAAPMLNEYIDHVLATHKLTADKLALVGFSQGTMMSLHVAPRREEKLACVVGYSGALVEPELLPKERKSAPPVLLVHGTHDDVVPFASMNYALAGLHSANINASGVPCEGVMHSINDKGVEQGALFLRKALGY